MFRAGRDNQHPLPYPTLHCTSTVYAMNPRAVEAFVMMALGIMVVALRLHVRISTVGWKKLQPDDYLMVLAAVTHPNGHPQYRYGTVI